MLTRPEKVIQARADRLLRQAGILMAPVDLKRVLAVLKVDLRKERGDDDISGALYRLDSGPVIGVNADHPSKRQRFTTAHEIGHLLLHDLPVFIDRSYAADRLTDIDPRFLRNSESSNATDPLEIEANRFAACLLMPRMFIKRDLQKTPLPIRADKVAEFAERYKVSTQAMTFRLTNLGVPLDVA